MTEKSRADYFRKRRRNMKQLVFMIDKEKGEALDRKLKEKGVGRTEWFRQKVEEEITEK